MDYSLSGEIRSNLEGFAALAALAEATKDLFFESVNLDMGGVSWFDAHMSAPLGAILYAAARGLNAVTITNARPHVETILCKNGFLSNYGRAVYRDTFGTTIEYRNFKTSDSPLFSKYIDTHLRGHGLPDMSAGLRKKFLESISEIFSNAVVHAESRWGIFACGQFFPKKNRLDFSLVDLGIGIRENVKRCLGLELPPDQAINWAADKRNTTKQGTTPGGLGLKLIREFVDMNGGRILIVSDSGFWERFSGQTKMATMAAPFPGTVVNLEFATNDPNSYCLTSEIDLNDIF